MPKGFCGPWSGPARDKAQECTGFTGGAFHLSGGLELTAVPFPDVIVGGIPSCVSSGGIQLVWHLAELTSEKLVRLLLMSGL